MIERRFLVWDQDSLGAEFDKRDIPAEIADEVEACLREAFPGAEVIIHQDPYGVEEPRARFV